MTRRLETRFSCSSQAQYDQSADPQMFSPIMHADQFLKPRFRGTSGSKLKLDGKNTVNVAAQGERLKVTVVVIDVVRPTISVATLNDKSSSATFGTDGAHLHRERPRVVGRGNCFPCQHSCLQRKLEAAED